MGTYSYGISFKARAIRTLITDRIEISRNEKVKK